jgi:hypothetical protein
VRNYRRPACAHTAAHRRRKLLGTA